MSFHTLIPCWLLLSLSQADAFVELSVAAASRRACASDRDQSLLLHLRRTRLDAFNQQLGEFETLNIIGPTVIKDNRQVELYDYSSHDPIRYQEIWDFQKDIMQGQLDRIAAVTKGEISEIAGSQFYSPNAPSRPFGHDTIIMLQHQPVYTLGTGSDPAFIKSAEERGKGGAATRSTSAAEIDIVRIERGGEVTYHGPGQLVVYPILDLRGYKQDIHWYVRALEEAILIALDMAGVKGAVREDDVTGIWIEGNKVAALGVKVRRWATMHGLAVNVDKRSLDNFAGIVPCGLERDVTCINDHLDDPISVDEFAPYMKKALENVFEVEIVEATDR